MKHALDRFPLYGIGEPGEMAHDSEIALKALSAAELAVLIDEIKERKARLVRMETRMKRAHLVRSSERRRIFHR